MWSIVDSLIAYARVDRSAAFHATDSLLGLQSFVRSQGFKSMCVDRLAGEVANLAAVLLLHEGCPGLEPFQVHHIANSPPPTLSPELI